MDTSLKTGTSSSSLQTSTQSPQSSSTYSYGASQNSGGVQPGTTSSLLNSTNGISLSNTALNTVSLDNAQASTSTTTSPAAGPKHHHVNIAFLVIAVILIVAAVGMIFQINRSVKSTTE